jgi:Tfp pilus assembly protein PilN
MMTINLLPNRRQVRLQQRRRMRTWGIGVGVYTGVLGAVFAGAYMIRPPGPETINRQLASAELQIQDSVRVIATLQAEMKDTERTLTTMQRIGPKPDWSVALAEFGATAGEDIVIGDITMRQRKRSASAGGSRIDEPSDAVTLRVSGYGRNQRAVTDFLMALNQSGLIDSTKLLKSEREPLFGGYAAAFIVECDIIASMEKPS